VGKIERGKVNVSVRTAYKLAKALDLTLSVFS
jgi:DNA-binding XRE family transcriptional regulator